MKYKAVRPFYGDGGMVKKGQLLDLDKDRARELGALVAPVSETPTQPTPPPANPLAPDAQAAPGAKLADAPLNKMADEPVNKAAPAPKTKRAPKE